MREIKRLNINLPVDLIERIDEYADKMSINRTSAVSILVTQALDSQRTINTLEELVKLSKLQQSQSE